MSNKLYTEEEIRRFFNEIYFLSSTVLDNMDSLTHIELPSDDEIWNKADEEDKIGKHYAFIRGARYVIDKIQGGNNES